MIGVMVTRIEIAQDFFFTDEDEEQTAWGQDIIIVKLSKLVQRGHLHVLEFLHGEFKNGLQRYCKPAIQYEQIEILEWIHSLCYMNPNDKFHHRFDFCLCAVENGNVKALNWLLSKGFDFDWEFKPDPMVKAIRSMSTEIIQICFDLGMEFPWHVVEAIRETKCLDVYRKVHDLGYDFKELQRWYDQYKPWEIEDSFEIIKFLRSVSVPWSEKVMSDILQYGTLEMIRTAHEDGCPWSSLEGYHASLSSEHASLEKCMFLIENGHQFHYDFSCVGKLSQKKDLALLALFVGKDSNFDNALFKRIGECLPWTLDNTTNTVLLSKIACFNELDDVKWAYENGCKGGQLVPFIKEEWVSSGIRQRKEWNANRSFFEEKGLLALMNIQEIGDAQLGFFLC